MADLPICATIGITPESLDNTFGKDDTLYFLTERGLASRTDINPAFLPAVLNVNAPSEDQLRIGGYIQPTDLFCRLSATGPAVIRRSIFTDLTRSEEDPSATSVHPNQVWPMSERLARGAVSVEPGEAYAYDNQWSLPLENGETVSATGVMDLQTPFDHTKEADVKKLREIVDEIKRFHKDFGNEATSDKDLERAVDAIPKAHIEALEKALEKDEAIDWVEWTKNGALAVGGITVAAIVFDIWGRFSHWKWPPSGPTPPMGPSARPSGNRVGNGPSGPSSPPHVVKFEPVDPVVPITTAVETATVAETARQVLTTTVEVVAENPGTTAAVVGTAVAIPVAITAAPVVESGLSIAGRWLAGRAATAGIIALADGPEPFIGDVVGAVFLIGSVGYLAWNYSDIVAEGATQPEA